MSNSPLSLGGISIKGCGLSALCDHVVGHIHIFQCTKTAAVAAATKRSMEQAVRRQMRRQVVMRYSGVHKHTSPKKCKCE